MSSTTAERVIAVIAKTQHIPPESVTLDSSFEQLKIDSLDGINVVFAVEEEFNIEIPDDSAKLIRTVQDVIDGVDKLVAEKAATPNPTNT